MSLLAPLERIIHRLDGEAAAELSAVKAGFEAHDQGSHRGPGAAEQGQRRKTG